MYFSFLPFRPSHQLARSRSDSVSEAKGLLRIILTLQQRSWPGRPRYWRVRMMRSWTVPLSSWRWASAACCMGMVVCAQTESAIGQQGHRLIQGTGSTVGGVWGEPDAKVSGSRVRQGDDPPRSASQGDRVGQDTLAG